MSTEEITEIHEESDGEEYLTFVLSDDDFAVSIMSVKEILEFRELTKVPMVPPYIRGAINLRGAVVPVIDLAVKFGLPSSDVSRRTCIVIMETNLDGEAGIMGIIVDKVLQVSDIPLGDIEPAPSFGAKIKTDFMSGMGKIDDKFVIILNIDRVLSAEEIAVVGHIGNEQSQSENVSG